MCIRDSLYIAGSNKVTAWQIGFRSRERLNDQPPVIKKPLEDITVSQGTTNLSFDLLNVFTDPDDDDSLIRFGVETNDKNGLIEATVNGSQLQLRLSDFEGEVIVNVSANSFGQIVRTSFIVKIVNTNLKIELFDIDGNSITSGQTVSGALTGKVTVNNKMGQHAQFYQNFRTLPINGTTHIKSNTWERTFSLDTTSFYDGENLISMHVHPVNVEGQAYTTQFNVSQFKIVTSNNNPSPNGDTQLPTLSIDKSKIVVSPSKLLPGHVLDAVSGAFDIQDDFGLIQIDQSPNSSRKAQVIPHLGASVLGRFRWTGNRPPWGEDFKHDIFGDVQLINFQKESTYRATLVLFFNDDSGRANYGFYAFDMPAIADVDRAEYTLPSLDSKFLNVSQGQEIIIQEDEGYSIKVEVNVTAAMADKFPLMTTWIGNRAVAETKLADYVGSIPANESSFVVDVEIPINEIRKLQNSRQGGYDSVAFAIWNDFSSINVRTRTDNLPSSEHVHVSMIRTSDIDANYQDNDNDGLVDLEDNCPNVYNPNQIDTNGDGFGDVCYGDPLKLNLHPSLGEYFAGGTTSIKSGYSLYVFDNDVGSGGSVCYDTCAAHWPPLLVGNLEELDAVNGISNLATIVRDDGSLQVTHYGKPLYFYASDLGSGDSSGHGVNGVWWLAVSNPVGDFQWDGGTLNVDEDVGSFDIQLNKINGVKGEISVQLKTIAGSASTNLDFTAVDQTITFAEGEITKIIPISILEDSTDENNETLSLELSNPSLGSLIVNSGMTIIINDNDEPQPNTGGSNPTTPPSSGGGGGGSLNIMMLFLLLVLSGLKSNSLSYNRKFSLNQKR